MRLNFPHVVVILQLGIGDECERQPMNTIAAPKVSVVIPVYNGARLIERWAFYFAREAVQAVNDLWRGT